MGHVFHDRDVSPSVAFSDVFGADYEVLHSGDVAGLLLWTFVPSNVAGRTKKSVTSVILFVRLS